MKNFTILMLLLVAFSKASAQSPIVYAGKNQVTYAGSPVQLKGRAYKVKNVIWTTEGNGYFENPNSLTTIYHPGQADINAGKVRLILSAANNAGIRDKVGVTILPHICASLAMPAQDDICADNNGGEYLLNKAVVTGDNYSAKWTITSNNADPRSYISDDTSVANAIFYYTASDGQAGATIDFQLTLTDNLALCPPISATISVRFRDRPRVDAFFVNGVNEYEGPAISCGLYPASLEAYIAGPVNTVFFGGGTGRIEKTGPASAVYYPTPSDAGSYVSFTIGTDDPEGPCSGTGSSNAVIYDFGIPDAGPDRTVCLSNTDSFITVSASIFGSASNPIFYWGTNGTGSFDDQGAYSTRYYFTNEDLEAANLSFYATYESCLPNTDTVVVTLVRQPVVSLGGLMTICGYTGGQVPLIADLSGQVDNFYWSTSGNGSFGDVNNPNTEYFYSDDDVNLAFITLTATAEISNESCSFAPAIGQLILNLQAPAQVIIQDEYLDLCNNTTSFGVSADVYGYYSNGQWSSSGTGTFDNPNQPYSSYTVSEADIASGCIWLSYQVEGAGECGGSSDNITICFQDCGAEPAVTRKSNEEIEPLLFPNPATTSLNIKTTLSLLKSNCVIADMQGKSYPCKWINARSIDISALPSGAYIIRLATETKVWSLKFIKQ